MEHLVGVSIVEELLKQITALLLAVDKDESLSGVLGSCELPQNLKQPCEALVVGAQLDDLLDV
jgi:hypothetical protein